MFNTRSSSRQAQRDKLAAEVEKWRKAGNKITQVPIGVSGYADTVLAPYRANGLKKINNPKYRGQEDV